MSRVTDPVTRPEAGTAASTAAPAVRRRGRLTVYLGAAPGGAGVSPYAAPARREDLSGLPPAWMGVGSVDLFHDEDVAYARRLTASGVPCELRVVPGAFHGFDALFPRAGVSRQFWRDQAEALLGALLMR